MNAPALALLAVHAATAGAGGATELHLSAAAGAGHDSNVSHDPSAAAAVASALVLASAAAGVSRSTAAWTLGADLLADAAETLDVPDLSEVRAGAGVVLGYSPRGPFAFTGSGEATRSWWRDRARDGWGASALASVRLRVLPRLALTGSYGRTWKDADDPVYSFVADRLAARAEVRVAGRSYLRAGIAWAWRDEVFYVPIATAASAGGAPADAGAPEATGPGRLMSGGGAGGSGGGTRRGPDGRPITSSFPGGDREVVKSDARTRTARAGLELSLRAGLYLDLDVSYATVSADLDGYDAWVGVALLGFSR